MSEIGAFLFLLGMSLSLGSIATFIVMNQAVGSSSNVTLIYHQRVFAAASSRALTIPGVGMLLAAAILSLDISGRHPLADACSLIRLVLAGLIFINTVVFIRPLVAEVFQLAEQSAAAGRLVEGYHRRKALEDRFGAANLLMIIALFLLAVFRA